MEQLEFEFCHEMPTQRRLYNGASQYRLGYEEYIARAQRAKTTDDTFTPPYIYEWLLEQLEQYIDLEPLNIIRPFYPDRDYLSEYYPANAIVIDNPPFSLFIKIIRNYQKMGIPFVLFGDARTIFSVIKEGCTVLMPIGKNQITYENGVKVATAFASNCFGDARIITLPNLPQPPQSKLRTIIRNKPDNYLSFNMLRNYPAGEIIRNCDIERIDTKSYYGDHVVLKPLATQRKKQFYTPPIL